MGDVTPFPGLTTLPMEPRKILTAADEAGIAPVIVVGLDDAGALYVSSSAGNSNEVLGLLTRAVVWLSNQADG